jgi:hypothetical protein
MKTTRPAKSTCDEQPKLQPDALSLSAIISQYFIGAERGSSYEDKQRRALSFFRCGRRDEFLEARIIPERIEHRVEPDQRRSERHV